MKAYRWLMLVVLLAASLVPWTGVALAGGPAPAGCENAVLTGSAVGAANCVGTGPGAPEVPTSVKLVSLDGRSEEPLTMPLWTLGVAAGAIVAAGGLGVWAARGRTRA